MYKVGPEIDTLYVGSPEQFVSLIMCPSTNLSHLVKPGIRRLLCNADGLSLEATINRAQGHHTFGINQPTGLMHQSTNKSLCVKTCCSEYSSFDVSVDGIKFATIKPTLVHVFLPNEDEYHSSSIHVAYDDICDQDKKNKKKKKNNNKGDDGAKSSYSSTVTESQFDKLKVSPFSRVTCGDDLAHFKETFSPVDVTAYFSKTLAQKMADPTLNSQLRSLTHRKNFRIDREEPLLWNVAFMTGIQTQFVIRPIDKSLFRVPPKSISMKYMLGKKQTIRGTVDKFTFGTITCLENCPLFPKSCIPPEYERLAVGNLVVYGFCDISEDVTMVAFYFFLPLGASGDPEILKCHKKKNYLEQHIRCVAFSRSDRVTSVSDHKESISDDYSLDMGDYAEILEDSSSDEYYYAVGSEKPREEEPSEHSQDIPIRMGIGDLDHTMIYKLDVIRDPWWQTSKLYPQLYQKKHWDIMKKVLLEINTNCGTELFISQKHHEAHQPQYHFDFYRHKIELKSIDGSYYEARLTSDLDVMTGKLVNLKNFWLIVDTHHEDMLIGSHHRDVVNAEEFVDITSIIPSPEENNQDDSDNVNSGQLSNSVIFGAAGYLLSMPYYCGGLMCEMSKNAVGCVCCKSTPREV